MEKTIRQKKVKKVMREFKAGTVTFGRSGEKVKSRRQAMAIGLSEARRVGVKVPSKIAFHALRDANLESFFFGSRPRADQKRHELLNLGLVFQRMLI